MDRPYVLVSPDYDFTSGGIKVMWGLFGALLAKGVEVYMNRWPQKECIAIYPEIETRNPVPTDKIVRYILNTPGVMGMQTQQGFTQSPSSFPDTEKQYWFSRIFGGNKKSKYLFLPVINLHTFYDQKKKRTKTAYFIGKGTNLYLHPEDSILIDRNVASDQSQLADLLNECHTLYGYDPVSAMYEVSRLCGTKVVLLQNKYSEDQWNKYEPGRNGLAFGRAQMEGLTLDTEKFRDNYEDMIAEFNDSLEDFIHDTQEWK